MQSVFGRLEESRETKKRFDWGSYPAKDGKGSVKISNAGQLASAPPPDFSTIEFAKMPMKGMAVEIDISCQEAQKLKKIQFTYIHLFFDKIT